MNFIRKATSLVACMALLLSLGVGPAFAQQRSTGTLRGQVTDEFGGVLVGATVTAVDPNGLDKSVQTDSSGNFVLSGLVPGRYAVRVSATGFGAYENEEVNVAPGPNEPLAIALAVYLEKEEVTVASESPISLDETNRGDAIVLRGADLDALPDDPDELSAALQALAGPSAGPNGGQITIDGFEGGRIPPKSSIREVRINENPLSAERDQPGFGGIQILTKPGTDRLRGSLSTTFADESLNSRNPFSPERTPYQQRQFGGSLSGTIVPNKSSFFFDVDRSGIDDNDVINARVLDPVTLQPTSFRQSLTTPSRRLSVNPRLDWQINSKNTLVGRYSFFRSESDLSGLGSGFALPSRTFAQEFQNHTVQLTETAVLTNSIINETRFQYIRGRSQSRASDASTAINVADAFFGGGAQVDSLNQSNRWDATNITTIAKGNHSIKFGGRLRGVSLTDFSQNNFGGTYSFFGGTAPELLYDANGQIVFGANGPVVVNPAVQITSLERYRRTLLLRNSGLSVQQLRALGALPSQFNIAGGNPETGVSQMDFGGFVQEDWKVRPNLTLGAGLRYENQSNISSNYNFAPRFYLAWSPDGGAQRQPKTVIRFGAGLFYDRFNENLVLQTERFDGVNQLQFLVTDPATLGGFPAVPTLEALQGLALPQTTRRISSDLQTPRSFTTGVFLERQLPHRFTLNAGYITFRTRNALRAVDLNAAAPGTFPDGRNPLPHVYEYESTGRQNMNQVQVGVNSRFNPGLTIFASYTMMNVKNDTDGPNSFPSNPFDKDADYGRASFDVRHRFVFGGTVGVPKLKLLLNPMVIANTGRPFNIITGVDSNGDGFLNDRPAFATADTPLSELRRTPYGDFDIRPDPGQALIPRNYGEGPGFFTVNLRISRQFSFGDAPGAQAAAAAAPQGGSGGGGRGQGGGGRPAGGGPGGGGPGGGGGGPVRIGGPGGGMMGGPGGVGGPEKRYNLTLSVNFQNLLNNVNLTSPVGNLSSPFFGQSLQSFGGGFMFFGPGGAFGGGGAAGNRRVQLSARFSF